MNSFLFIFKKTLKLSLSNLILGLLNIATVTVLFIILSSSDASLIKGLNIIIPLSTLILISSAIVLCINIEFSSKIRDICILRAIGFQKYHIFFYLIINSILVLMPGLIIGIISGNIILFILFNISMKNTIILNTLFLGIISVSIGCISPLIKISKLKIPEVINR